MGMVQDNAVVPVCTDTAGPQNYALLDSPVRPQEPTEEVDASAFCRSGGRCCFALSHCGAALALTSDERCVPLLLRGSAGVPC